MVAVVFGAGGPTGELCVAALAAQGAVRAVVRSPDKYKEKFDNPKVELVQGDVTDEASLEQALQGATGVIFACSAATYRGADAVDHEAVRKVANACRGQCRVVLVSSRLVNPVNRWSPIRILLNNIKWGLMDAKWAGEEALRASGCEYCIVRPGGLLGGDTQRKQEQADFGPGEQHVLAGGAEADLGVHRSIHRGDVATVCVEALSSSAARNKTVELVARDRGDLDPSFAEHVKALFADVPPCRGPQPVPRTRWQRCTGS